VDHRAARGARAGERAAAARTGLSTSRLGASFSTRRARAQGLDEWTALRRLLELGLSPVRLSTYWDEVDRSGYDELDRQLSQVERAGGEVVLTVGMKAQGWPEFAIPERLALTTPPGGDVGAGDPVLRSAVLELVEATVERYRDERTVVAWQVENEPLNRSGPRRWWICPELLREAICAVRRVDAARPVVVNVFAAFNAWLDAASSRHGLRRLLGRDALRPEAEALALLGPGDVLGLDVYRRIGYHRLGRRRYTSSRGWAANAARWRERAEAAGRRAWIVEAQAEPWEPGAGRQGPPASCRPEDVVETVETLRGAGYDTILLWGVEHWLARDAAGDDSWLAAVGRLLDAG
jgi:hypothetical protein